MGNRSVERTVAGTLGIVLAVAGGYFWGTLRNVPEPAVNGVQASAKPVESEQKLAVGDTIVAGDTVAVMVNGVFAIKDSEKELPPPVFSGRRGIAFTGFPLQVNADGTVRVPLIDPVQIGGLKTHDAEEQIKQGYVKANILAKEYAVVTITRVTSTSELPDTIKDGDLIAVYLQSILPSDIAVPPPVNQNESGQCYTGFPLRVSGDGMITMPLIDPVKVSGLTIRQAEAAIAAAYVKANILSHDRASPMLTIVR